MDSIIFPHPAPARAAPGLLPVFLPAAGCPGRCVFCAPDAQTGVGGHRPGADSGLETALDFLNRTLGARTRDRPPLDVGFYGGSFTGLPLPWMEACLAACAGFVNQGVAGRVRCSTRPDLVDARLLGHLRGLGLSMVELGVQTFHDPALAAAGRGHDARTAIRACRLVRQAGLELAVHLMPGLPLTDAATFARDTARTVSLKPDSVRLHPCLVLEHTALARDFGAGRFVPWSLEATLEVLGRAVADFWEAGIAVSRIGLCPQDTLEASVLAGPRHPCLGQRARSRALLAHVSRRLPGGSRPGTLAVPWRHRSDFAGWRREMLPAWAGLGLGPRQIVHLERGAGEDFILEVD